MNKELTDQIGKTFSFDSAPKRIVSLVPSQTELLVNLGLEESIVGLTKFCIHPIGFKNLKTIVGGTKAVNFEKIAALKPDIIICNKEENTQQIVEDLSSICTVWTTDIYTIADNNQMILDFGKLFDVEELASIMVSEINTALSEFRDFVENQKSLNVAYFIWKNPYMVAANSTFINEILKLNNFQNVYDDLDRYPEIDIRNLNEKKLDFVLLSSEPYPFKESDFQEFGDISDSYKVVLVDGEMFSWYGSRLILAFDYFKKLRIQLNSYKNK